MTRRTLGQSRPIPNATVAITTHNVPCAVQNNFRIDSLTAGVAQAVNMSTKWKQAKSQGPTGSVALCPKHDLIYRYIIEQLL